MGWQHDLSPVSCHGDMLDIVSPAAATMGIITVASIMAGEQDTSAGGGGGDRGTWSLYFFWFSLVW